MSGLAVADLAVALARLRDRADMLEARLNEADAKLGDGDTGSMVARVVERMAEVDLSTQDDVGQAFGQLARAASAATGSSLGTLLATALLTAARESRGSEALPWSQISALCAAARDAMAARGRASLGEKTVLDGLDGLAQALDGLDEPAAMQAAAREAMTSTLDAFRDRPCQVGRARLFAERSVGLDDPGMLALALMVDVALPAGEPGAGETTRDVAR
ncbi:DAK2 domain-containing protein [Afifella pfennigii]|uniref:DAK2 domain-containing protein n=1 Tax=Afifella pfennigii TaxID=209897 RepID=UPI000B1782F3|nr:DAK2 domain-containing protein [Afifella pfennigii]